MAQRRVYPDPDPILRFMPSDPPAGWLAMDPQRRSVTGRYVLVLLCAGLHPFHAWMACLTDDPVQNQTIRDLVDPLTDAQIEGFLREAARRRRTELQNRALS